MAKSTRLLKSISRLLLPVILVCLVAGVSASIWLVHEASRPLRPAYLVTPEKYGLLSSRGAQITEETWTNKDGTTARGWLLKGGENAPAVLLLHKYGADRSYVLNLAVKLSEATDFTVLIPDQRGHGQNPPVEKSTFGSSEAEDAASALEYLKGLKTANGGPLVGTVLGVYGVEMGAAAGLTAAAGDPAVKALVLDSIPKDADSVLSSAVVRRFPFAGSLTSSIARFGTTFYFYEKGYASEPACDSAKAAAGRKVLLLAGLDAPEFQDSTSKISKCFPAATAVESKLDLSPSGYSIMSSSLPQSEAYDARVIEFFKSSMLGTH